MRQPSQEERIRSIYATLAAAWGRQHWWPSGSRFEVIVGAYLTQNTSWRNVEMAIANLRSRRVLSPAAIRRIPLRRLEQLVRSSGYFRQKARRLKAFAKFLEQRYRGSLKRMFARPTGELREQLLSLPGIGPETADSILLYAGQHEVFVVDAYTRRVAARHDILAENASYEEYRELFERALALAPEPGSLSRFSGGSGGASHRPSPMSRARRSPLAEVFGEMHGLIVGVGKHYCLKSKAHCSRCPLEPLLPSRSE